MIQIGRLKKKALIATTIDVADANIRSPARAAKIARTMAAIEALMLTPGAKIVSMEQASAAAPNILDMSPPPQCFCPGVKGLFSQKLSVTVSGAQVCARGCPRFSRLELARSRAKGVNDFRQRLAVKRCGACHGPRQRWFVHPGAIVSR
jgi:hypothetical protein